MLQARINDLQNKLSQAYIVDKSNLPTDRVVYGSKVRVLDLDSTKRKTSSWSGPARKTTTRTRSCSPARSARAWSASRSASRSRSRSPRRPQAEDRRDRVAWRDAHLHGRSVIASPTRSARRTSAGRSRTIGQHDPSPCHQEGTGAAAIIRIRSMGCRTSAIGRAARCRRRPESLTSSRRLTSPRIGIPRRAAWSGTGGSGRSEARAAARRIRSARKSAAATTTAASPPRRAPRVPGRPR